MISVRELKSQAEERTGLSDFGGSHFEPILAGWVEDLNHEPLSETGRHVLKSLLVTDLCRRLTVVQAFKDFPETEDVKLPPILYVSGHERSGTTLLHNLLSLVPDNRALLRWELMHPVPPPEKETYWTDPRIAKTKASIDKLRGSKLEELHWVEADEPDECAWALLNGIGILGGAAGFVTPHWLSVWDSSNGLDALREYRKLLQLLLLKNPVPEGSFLVLKSPQFSTKLSALHEVLPEARFVLTHRDPFRLVTSVAALTAHINRPFVDNPERFEAGGSHIQVALDRMETCLQSLMTFDRNMGNVINVNYAKLVRSPETVVTEIYDALNKPLGLDSASKIGAFLTAQREGKRKKPTSAHPDFGLTQEDVLSRTAVRAYCDYFGVETESKRQTG